MTAENVELDKSRWYFQHGKRGIKRFVYLTFEAEEIMRRVVASNPTDPIFRNTRGQPWDRHSVKCRFERLAPKVGRRMSLYLFRHAHITRQVASGMDSHVVAQLASHITQDWEFMRDKLRESPPGPQEPPSPSSTTPRPSC